MRINKIQNNDNYKGKNFKSFCQSPNKYHNNMNVNNDNK